jgi:hypothetical protein
MFGYSLVASKSGYKTKYIPLDNMLNGDIEILLTAYELKGYMVELIKEV